MKLAPPHHKTVAIPRVEVVKGYGGARLIPNAGPGWWIIVAASQTDEVDNRKRPPPAMVEVIVAPYTRGTGT